MRIIQSRTNPEIKRVASLHTNKYREQYQQFIAEGTRVCSTLINASVKLHMMYVTHGKEQEVSSFVDDSHITVVSDVVMGKLSGMQTPSGILGVFYIPRKPKPEQLRAGLVLANITDPGNMGTLIRSCAAFGFKSVVIVNGVDVWSSKVIQASAGTIGLVDVFQLDWNTLVLYARKQQLSLCALIVHGGKKPEQLVLHNTLLIVGNESTGIPDTWLHDCNQLLTLPMMHTVESLNASIAGSLALYLTAMYAKQ